jgi:hypothetical protein
LKLSKPDPQVATSLLALGIALALAAVVTPPPSNPDGLYYESMVLRVAGVDRSEAVERTFSSERAETVARQFDDPLGRHRVRDPAWVEHTGQFFERRWFVPSLAYVWSRISGHDPGRSLHIVSMAGYAMIGTALFLLLRLRFATRPAALAAFAGFSFPLLFHWSDDIRTDSWGLLLLIAGLWLAVSVMDRGLKWLPLWIVTMVALSFTRETFLVLLLVALGLLVHRRASGSGIRRGALLSVTGAAAVVPAMLIGESSIQDHLAYVMSGAQIPHRTDWGFVLGSYPEQIRYHVEANLRWAGERGMVGLALYPFLLAGTFLVVVLAVWRSRGDLFLTTMRLGLLGSVGLLFLVASPSGFRLELVLIPFAATGAALLLDRLIRSGRDLWAWPIRRRGVRATARSASARVACDPYDETILIRQPPDITC